MKTQDKIDYGKVSKVVKREIRRRIKPRVKARSWDGWATVRASDNAILMVCPDGMGRTPPDADTIRVRITEVLK